MDCSGKPNKGIQATALNSDSVRVKTGAAPPPRLMPEPLGIFKLLRVI